MTRLLAIVAIIVCAFLTIRSAPAPALPRGAVPVPTTDSWHVLRTEDEVDGRVRIRGSDGVGRDLLLRDGALYDPDPDDKAHLGVILVRERYLIDPGWDLGAWAGVRADPVDSERPDRFQAGLRFSPVRLGYGVLAADLVASEGVGGVGVSAYPPVDLFGPHWRHLGIGCWYTVPWNGDGPGGLALGLAFSVRN